MTPRTALAALHVGALFFGLTGVFGKLASVGPAVIVFGRAAFAVLALADALVDRDQAGFGLTELGQHGLHSRLGQRTALQAGVGGAGKRGIQAHQQKKRDRGGQLKRVLVTIDEGAGFLAHVKAV